MGMYYSVRGWIQCTKAHVEQARAIIEKNGENNPYIDSWVFPTVGGGYSRFIFFGCTVRNVCLSAVKQQIQRIATEITEQDGDDTDYPEGIFHVTYETGSPDYIWTMKDGKFLEIQKG